MFIVNGVLMENPQIILDEGFMFGRGIFETLLVKEKPIFLKDHIDRMNKSLSILNISKKIDKNYIETIVDKYKLTNCVLKIVASDKNTVISTRSINYHSEDYKKGFKVRMSKLRRNSYSTIPYIKSINYIENILEKQRSIEEGFNETLFLNTDGYIAESSSGNIFFIKDDKLYTPSVNCGLLNGILRQWILNNFHVTEGNFTLEDILNSQGAFLTNSIMGIMKIVDIDEVNLSDHCLIEEISTCYKKEIYEY
jgi:4-amino-4-deoxychorismate lyase